MGSKDTATFATRSIHGGQSPKRTDHNGDVVSPVHLASTFRLGSVPDRSLDELDPSAGEYLYSRLGNPTRQTLEERLADLSGAERGFAFASGTAAVVTTVLASVKSGDSIVAFDDLYGGSIRLLQEFVGPRLDVDIQLVDATTTASVADAIDDRCALVLVESPTNPLLQVCDIEAIADVAHESNVPVAVDNTFATPYLQQPLDLGADIAIHSTTKYLNGHSDGLGGFVATNDESIADQLAFLQRVGLGNPLPPFDSYLVLRGIKTLATRMDVHQQTAMQLAETLDGHPAVESVHYPGLESHPQHELASRQMAGFGGMLSFELRGDGEDACRFLEALETIPLAVSLGGVESLIELPAQMTHEGIDPAVRRERGIADSLVRLSVGLEGYDDIWRDLERGFTALGGNA